MPGEGGKVRGFSALMRHSMAWPLKCTSSWVKLKRQRRQRCGSARGQIDAGDHLGDGMLDLEAGVHLDEDRIRRPRKGTRWCRRPGSRCLRWPRPRSRRSARAASSLRAGEGVSSMIFWWRRCSEQSRSPRWHDAALAVAHHLHFDVARAARGSVRGRPHRRRRPPSASARAVESALGRSSSVRATFMPRPPPPAAALISTGKPIRAAIADRLPRCRHRAVRARHHRNAKLLGGLLGRDLVAHDPDMLGRGADEGNAVLFEDLGEARVLGKKAVARMNGVGAR